MTDTTGNPAMPAALAAMTDYELGRIAWEANYQANRLKGIKGNQFKGNEWTKAAGSVLRKELEAALAPDGPDQGGA